MIDCMLTCKVCKVEKLKFSVRARRDGEDLMYWMRKVVERKALEAHTRHSLLCPAKKYDLYIPTFEDAQWVGQELPEVG